MVVTINFVLMLSSPMFEGGSLVLKNDVFNMSCVTDKCNRYDIDGNYWTEMTSMYYPRMYHSIAALGGFIYALGGETTGTCDGGHV